MGIDMSANLMPPVSEASPPTDISSAVVSARFEATRRAIEAFARETRRDNTERAYATDLKFFWAWAWLTVGMKDAVYPVHPSLIEKFVADALLGFDKDVEQALVDLGIKKQTGPLKLSTVRQRLWALGRAHVEKLGEDYSDHVHTHVVRQLLKRAAKQAQNQTTHPEAINRDALLRILAVLDDDPIPRHVLIAAVMATAFGAGGLRRSEICALSMGGVHRLQTDEAPGYLFTLAICESKTHVAGDDAVIQPVRGGAAVYLDRWLRLREKDCVTGDPLFRAVRPDGGISKGISETWLYEAIKEAAGMGGLDPARISPHSLRFGYVTSAHRSGITLKDAMAMSRHKSPTVHLRYLEEQSKLEGEAGKLLPTEIPDR